MSAFRLVCLPALVLALSAPICTAALAAPAVTTTQSFHAARLPASFFAGNRARLLAELKKMGPGTIAIIKSMPEQNRNGDSHHMYRQDSDFYYLTGIEEAESVAILNADSDKPYTLLVRTRDARRERYDGARLGVEGAVKQGADQAESFPAAEKTLKEAISKAQRVVLISNFDEDFRKKALDLVYPFGSDNNHASYKKILVDGRNLVAEMRLIKQAAEIEMLQNAVDVTAAGHLAAMKASLTASNEGEVAAAFQGTTRRLGARFTGYDTIAGAGGNSCTLHYVTNDHAIEKNGVMLLDAGAEVGYYTADVTRTWPVSGKFSKEQKAIYELVLKAQNTAIDLVKAGRLHHEGFDAAMRVMSDGLIDLGILKGDKEALYKSGAYSRFTMHGISHWIGLDVHDAGGYQMEPGKRGGQRVLQAGMALTVEPGIYIPSDANDVDAKWRGIGVRIEDVVLITPEGNRNMSGKLPRSVEAIEAALAK
ncbi:aminopeptidase P N-terminal domain-containing protein [Undibacterium sp. LX40W]|uniref:Xaa-Pro aminopeptidase n=1 Tax=Undibacterium nitidum TaxID=2762298 RepID=A0A923KMR5_9BURK|nr:MULTISPECIES: aminopeptidase P N-terminal domain-containing protein [Undibacterium]MBC3883185.1 aminopeptidase P N-terminal domain-containing protein [Undibacterium nitidum]MBC3893467.1 aminopeptidase P N-terminal domain-containing protein [Undibacterium sp. LX40W]